MPFFHHLEKQREEIARYDKTMFVTRRNLLAVAGSHIAVLHGRSYDIT
jgi:hypothetical protein